MASTHSSTFGLSSSHDEARVAAPAYWKTGVGTGGSSEEHSSSKMSSTSSSDIASVPIEPVPRWSRRSSKASCQQFFMGDERDDGSSGLDYERDFWADDSKPKAATSSAINKCGHSIWDDAFFTESDLCAEDLDNPTVPQPRTSVEPSGAEGSRPPDGSTHAAPALAPGDPSHSPAKDRTDHGE